MKLNDIKEREVLKVGTLHNPLTCWECTNKILPQDTKPKKRVVFKDGSQVILCMRHFMTLIESKG